MYLRFSSLRYVLFLGAVTSFLLHGTSATAAERVVLKYGAFRGPVAVSDLTNLTKTGEVSSPLRFYLKRARQDPETVSQALTQEVKADPVLLDRVLNSPAGEELLDQVSQVIHTPSGKTDRQALRSALILSAAQDGKITPIEAIQNYPTSELEVEGKRLKQLGQTFRQFDNLRNRVQDLLNIRKIF